MLRYTRTQIGYMKLNGIPMRVDEATYVTVTGCRSI
jgi:hypothetical protein